MIDTTGDRLERRRSGHSRTVFLLFGFGSKQKDLGPGQVRTCPTCGNTSQWHLVRQYRQFTVFFVPLLRWGRRRFEVCGICGTAIEV